jgi:biofilm PGA synthesis lipoprotein PgaB
LQLASFRPSVARVRASAAFLSLCRYLPFFLLALCAPPAEARDEFVALSYHDIQDEVAKDIVAGQTAVATQNLIAQFDWLKREGWQVIDANALRAAKAGRKRLPEKAALLSFDDGYASFYAKVFPLLKRYGYPAVLAAVGDWMAPGKAADAPREALLTWAQIREMRRSGLVEIASHSHGLHRGVLGNPQGNLQPAGTTRLHDPATKTYEDDAAYLKRIRAEMRRASDDILENVGARPRIMVWPYGEANRIMVQAAREAGMDITLALGDGSNGLADLPYAHRLLVAENPDIADFARMMNALRQGDRPLRVVHADLDYIYDPDPAQTERNLGLLLDRVQAMRVNTVYLQAYADPDGDGNAEALYFPNRHLPMRADLFNRAAWQLQTRARVKVYAWMPVLAFRVQAPESWFVHEWRDAQVRPSGHIYKRLSPFNPQAKRIVEEIYEDLAKYCNFSGLLFHDDAILSDYEDVTPQALAVAKNRWGLPTEEKKLRGDPAMRMVWAKHKTQALIAWTLDLAAKVRDYRPDIKTARNLYALPVLQPNSEEWYAQSLPSALAAYDYVAIEAMPFMEQAENPDAWLKALVQKVAAQPHGLRKTVFELQTVDWKTSKKIPMDVFLGQARLVEKLGGINLGYYPDNPFEDQPRLEDMESAFALPRYP